MSLTKIICSIRILIVCTSCKTSYNVLSHSHWGLSQFFGGGGGGGGGSKKRQSPDFRSPEVGISVKGTDGGNEKGGIVRSRGSGGGLFTWKIIQNFVAATQ